MNVIVNATALTHSGALTILEQFVHNAVGRPENYTIFVDRCVSICSRDNVEIIHVNKKGWISRIWWDSIGLRTYVKREKIGCDLVISLQNTSVNYPGPKVIYIHQPIPFSDIDFSFFKKSEWTLALYKRFYSYFIFRYVDEHTRYVVQTRWMKNSLATKFGIELNRIDVIKPNVEMPSITEDYSFSNECGYFKLIYPATFFSYKNHEVVIRALAVFKKSGDLDKIKFQVTLDDASFNELKKYAQRFGVDEVLENIGYVPRNKLYEFYNKANLLVFPSYLETFGLPLAEAAVFGKKILCSDLPYARDVLLGYDGAIFVPFDDEVLWSEKLKNILNDISGGRYSYDGFQSSGWDDFFNLISEGYYVR
ncbi:glycosyltransferase [Vibrio cholerae]|uniref:glycosyltransferase n=1 Tax=Vibrio cholerae TaxID=666 RepID=UPI0011589257|nr:glycosyltransferase [Vibrio cholerae]TQP52307.1 glycosyltransferase family 4 protein [Vibrio cholerae]TQP86649.1 glycosyltransferase family 4 protein [Vibrio cholerae]